MNDKGLAIISGGKYPIDKNLGETIFSFVPPPELLKIDKSQLNSGQKYLLENLEIDWQIIAHWLVYHRTLNVNIKVLPFNSVEFTNLRPISEQHNALLDLCAAIWEETEYYSHYETPYKLWKACILEIQCKQKIQILSNDNLDRNMPLKGEAEDISREQLRALKNGENPFIKTSENQHYFDIHEIGCNYTNFAFKEKRDYPKIRDAWKEYLKKFNLAIRELKNNNDIKMVYHLCGHVFYQGSQNKSTRIDLRHMY